MAACKFNSSVPRREEVWSFVSTKLCLLPTCPIPKEPFHRSHGRRAHSGSGRREGRRAGCVQKPAPGCGRYVSANPGLTVAPHCGFRLQRSGEARSQLWGCHDAVVPPSGAKGGFEAFASAVQMCARGPGSLFKSTPNPANVSLQASRLGWQNFPTMDEWSKTERFFKTSI